MELKEKIRSNNWAVILGGSSGFGLASAHKLSQMGMNLFIVHRDRKGNIDGIEEEFAKIKSRGVHFYSLNVNALTPEGENTIIQKLKECLELHQGHVKLLFHSIAFGNLKLLVPPVDVPYTEAPLALLEKDDFELTLYSMGTSLLTYVRLLFNNKLFDPSDARVLALTSEGNEIAWRGYAAVSAAKNVLESLSRSIAVEFAPYGIRSNILQPGVTDTPALRLIPGHEKMENQAKLKNPFKRMTTPSDVANVVYLMCTDEAAWINGTIIRVDGGEKISSL